MRWIIAVLALLVAGLLCCGYLVGAGVAFQQQPTANSTSVSTATATPVIYVAPTSTPCWNDQVFLFGLPLWNRSQYYDCAPLSSQTPVASQTPLPTYTPAATNTSRLVVDVDQHAQGNCNYVGNNNSGNVTINCNTVILPSATPTNTSTPTPTATATNTPLPTRTLAPLWTPTYQLPAFVCDEAPEGHPGCPTATCTPTPVCDCDNGLH